MPGHISAVSKGRIVRHLDASLNKPSQALLDRYVAGDSLTEIGVEELVVPPDAADHSDIDFFGADPDKSYWHDIPRKQEIARAAYSLALTIARSHTPPKPVITYWIAEVEDFHATVSETDLEVHVFLLTPVPKNEIKHDPPLPGIDERMWDVGTDAYIDKIVARYKTIGYEPEKLETVANIEGVKMLRLIGY